MHVSCVIATLHKMSCFIKCNTEKRLCISFIYEYHQAGVAN